MCLLVHIKNKAYYLFFLLGSIFLFYSFSKSKKNEDKTPINNTFIFSTDAQKKSFKIFDANNYQNAPDLTKYGLHKIEIIYEDKLTTHSNIYDKSSIRKLDEKKVIKEIHRLWKSNYSAPLVLDIETWQVEKHLDKYIDAIDIFKKLYGKNNVGYFGHSSYNPQLIKSSQVIYPAFYNESYAYQKWENNVVKTISTIKENNKSSPIYAFICPQYLINDRKATEFIDYDRWLRQLEFLYKFCDGVIIWGMPYYWDDKNNNKVVFFKWDENRAWWKATKDFIKKYNLK